MLVYLDGMKHPIIRLCGHTDQKEIRCLSDREHFESSVCDDCAKIEAIELEEKKKKEQEQFGGSIWVCNPIKDPKEIAPFDNRLFFEPLMGRTDNQIAYGENCRTKLIPRLMKAWEEWTPESEFDKREIQRVSGIRNAQFWIGVYKQRNLKPLILKKKQ
jgi:hypothetical protein